MKKLVAAGCCILFLQNVSKATGNGLSEQNSSGQKVLIKAIAFMVNTEASKKLPSKRIFIVPAEPPRR